MHNLGAEVVPVSKAQGGFIGAVKMAQEYAEEQSNAFLPRQFDNPDNVEAHEVMTGPEIEAQLTQFGVAADAFVAGVGTGGTVMGVARYPVSYTHLRAHETVLDLVCRLLLEQKN